MNFLSAAGKLAGFEEIYTIGWRKREGEADSLLYAPQSFTVLEDLKDTWYADPMIVERDGETHLFFEMYDRKKRLGGIGHARIESGTQMSRPRFVIREPYHLSFPFPFSVGDRLFIMPESTEINCLLFYECLRFPDKWKLHTRIDGRPRLADPILYQTQEGPVVLASELDEADPLKSSLLALRLTLREREDVFTVEPAADFTFRDHTPSYRTRSAGAMFQIGSRWVRPAQESGDGQYGRSLVFNVVDERGPGRFLESAWKTIGVSERAVTIANASFRPLGFHTYAVGGDYEVIDVKLRNFHPLKWLWRLKSHRWC